MSELFYKSVGALNERQREAVEWCEGPELVLAGAGSGKTRVLTAKIGYLIREKGINPRNIVALTFTNKAAREMLSRVNVIVGGELRGMQVSTFHAYGVRFLRRNKEALAALGYPDSFVIFDRNDTKSLIVKILAKIGANTKDCNIAWLIEWVSKAKTGADPRTLEPELEQRWRRVYDGYHKELKRQGAFDFEDLLLMPLHLLKTNPDVRARERARVDWVLVDEYQDVNLPQHLLLRELADGGAKLVAVGDPDQSIYGWRGADMSLIMDFARHFPGTHTVVLDRNYRSTGHILKAANAVIAGNTDRPEKNLWTSEGDGHKVGLLLVKNDKEEADAIADEIESLRGEGYNYSEMAVLYRVNALSRGYEQAFLERGIPYRVVRGVAFYDRREVKDILCMLRLAINPRDSAALERIGNIPARGLGKKGLADLGAALAYVEGDPEDIWRGVERDASPLKRRAADGARELASLMLGVLEREDDLPGIIAYLLHRGGYEAYIQEACPEDWEDRMDNIQELLSVMPDEGTIEEILAQVALFTDHELDERGEMRVNLLTLHAAKGLEYPVVFLPAMEEGVFPHLRSIGVPGAVAEERRLCYVGMTRAKERLFLSGAESRLLFGRFQREPFSRFIEELPEEYVETDDRSISGRGGNSVVRGGTDGRHWRW